MSVLLISYDAWTDPNPDPVRRIVEQYKHIQLSESTYAIETDEQTRKIFNKIIKIISLFEVDIHLLVITLIKPFASLPKGQVSQWLSKRLPED